MGTWIKETDKAVYLMEGGYYRQKIDKTPRNGTVEGETFFATQTLKDWLNSTDAPGFMLVSVGTGTSEPQPISQSPTPSPAPTPSPTPEPAPTPAPVPSRIKIETVPSQVKIYTPYQVSGTATSDLANQQVELFVDGNRTAVARTTIKGNGEWSLKSIFLAVANPQVRQLRVTAGSKSDTATLRLTPYIENHPGAARLPLSASVGNGGSNRASDVKLVRDRFRALGYTFIRSNSINDLIYAIRLFQSIIAGSTSVRGDGRIDVNRGTHRFLEAANAPRWMKMPGRGVGFYNIEVLDQPNDHHDFGIDWISNVIRAAGIHYELSHRKGKSNIALMAINDVSLTNGGATPDHRGHQTGNAGDIVLPHKGGRYGGITYNDDRYDQAAAEAMLRSLRAQPWVDKGNVYFNDPVLRNKGLCRYVGGHNGHIHFQLNVPARIG
ncbi:MAG: hypothetical protein AAFU71_17770 [Cyanobacteria bacterium J06632_22]